ncbi:hypothetical protein C2E23DRAFT_885258 [Lenzites betulinus]|nr:hypothetical protein C2E23DRAFT_885258 [Lenzites betulinus]
MVQNEVQQRVPTVNDLRIKLCYICREEERYDSPEDPPRAWTHPCSCTLVAHESCLLQWIKSSQQDSARKGNALKCPQCGAQYELESDNPLLLQLLNAVNGVLSAVGKTATVVGFGATIISFGFTIYVVSTSYGVFAVKEFLGEEMFNLLLTDDPSKWPWHAYIHLPVIPFSLILSRTRLFDTFPIIPLLLSWSTSPPVQPSPSTTPAPLLPSLPSLWGLARGGRPNEPGFAPALNWPPTPFMVMVFYPFVRAAYRRAFKHLTKYVMGSHTADTSAAGRIRRIILALNEPGPLRLRIGADIDPAQNAAPRPAGAGANANAAAAAAPNAVNAADAPPDDAAADAERTLHVTTSSLGRFVGGALLLPTIAARMGTLLLHLSQHSALLRAFLAIRPPGAPRALAWVPRAPDASGGLVRQVGAGMLTGINVLCGGTPTWNSHDPVWWRNSVGLGIFVVTKDCIRLLHLWLMKRELESRRVKSRSFEGVDVKELDLIRPAARDNDEAPAPEPADPQADAPAAPEADES